MSPRLLRLAVLCAALAVTPAALGRDPPEVGFAEHPGAALPLGAPVFDDDGAVARLGSSPHGARAFSSLGYYGCSNLCGVVLHGVAAALAQARLVAGGDVEVLAVSIDPLETPAAARQRKAQVLGTDGAPRGWHFLTADAHTIEAIADATGLGYAARPTIPAACPTPIPPGS